MLETVIPNGPVQTSHCGEHGEFLSRQYSAGWTTCPQCQRAEIAREARDHIAAQAGVRRLALIAAAQIPTRFESATVEGEHAKALRKWVGKAATGHASLVVLGQKGTGKSHLVCGTLNLALEQGVRCRYTTAARFLKRLTSIYDGADGTESELFAEFVEPTILVLDDVGANSGSEKLRAKLGDLIDERYLECRSTVVVSNLTPALLEEEIGDRAYSRTLENLTQINLTGKDRRRAA